MTEPRPLDPDHLAEAVKLRADRRRQAVGIPSLAAGLGRIGVLGWQIVLPALIGLAFGRWLDHRLGSGIFWTAPLLILGVLLGGWSAWKWIGAAMMMASVPVFVGFGVATGVAHFAALSSDAHLLTRGGSAIAAVGLKIGRLTLTVAVLLFAARAGGVLLVAAAGGLLIGRQVMLRQLGPRL